MTSVSSTSSTSSAGSTAAARTTLDANYTDFLKLLTTQLQNQDPLSPMDTDKFTSQLVQYSQVEQQLATNDKLDTLVTTAGAVSQSAAVNYLGAKVDLDDAITELSSSGSSVTYNLDAAATDVTLNYYDSSNTLVYSQVGKLAAGSNTVTWDGTLKNGTKAPNGSYRVAVTATDEAGAAIGTSVDSSGTVSAVTYDSNGVNLTVAGTTIPLASVRKVAVPSVSN